MKITIDLMDFFKSELIRNGKNEFFNNNQLTFFDDDFSFMKKVMKYDKDVEEIANNKLFIQFTLNNPEFDRAFKRAFINYFLNRQIQTQTIEGFVSKLTYVLLTHENFLNTLYEDYDNMLKSKQNSNGSTSGNTTTDNRNAYQSLPQNNINLDVDNTIVYSANDNTVNRNKARSEGSSQNETGGFNIDTFLKMYDIYTLIFDDIDKKCFLQVW